MCPSQSQCLLGGRSPGVECVAPRAMRRYELLLTNTGSVASKQTVLGFWRPIAVDAAAHGPLRQKLFAFESVVLQPGSSHVCRFTLDPVRGSHSPPARIVHAVVGLEYPCCHR
jgi:hypothetical protein